MPAYPWFLHEELDFAGITAKIETMVTLGVPYDDEIENAEQMARQRAKALFNQLVEADPSYADSGLENKKIMAVVAYMLRLGTDIMKTPPVENIESVEKPLVIEEADAESTQ